MCGAPGAPIAPTDAGVPGTGGMTVGGGTTTTTVAGGGGIATTMIGGDDKTMIIYRLWSQ